MLQLTFTFKNIGMKHSLCLWCMAFVVIIILRQTLMLYELYGSKNQYNIIKKHNMM